MNILLQLHKPSNCTSHDAVTAAKKLFKVRKAGHAGTLDPIATGVLLICFNEATKIAGFLSDLDKEYIMTAKLGETTDTYDSEGIITSRIEKPVVARSEIEAILPLFMGSIGQTPPMFSAIKMNGKPLYELARKGIDVERKPRQVQIHSIDILEFNMPYLRLRVSCSKGTYMRSLCNDIGLALGVGAHVTELVRTRIGDFTLENSASLEELPGKTAAMHSIDEALKHLRGVQLDRDGYARARHGNPVSLGKEHEGAVSRSGSFVRLQDPEGKTFGIGKVYPDSIKIVRLFNL